MMVQCYVVDIPSSVMCLRYYSSRQEGDGNDEKRDRSEEMIQ